MLLPQSTARSDGWKESLLQVYRDIWRDHDSGKPTLLYHYSNMEGIRGMLTSREFWLSDLCNMTDPSDGRYWLDVFRPLINRKDVPNYVTTLFNRTEDFGLGQLWHQYIICFSGSGCLERQWQKYADEGRGCAIELSFEALADHADGGTKYAYGAMLYDKRMQSRIGERIIDAAIQLARREEMTPEESKEYWQQCASLVFLTCGIRFKSPAYAPEQEWRISVTKPDPTCVRYRPLSRRTYVPLTIPRGAIKGIVKGRSCSCAAEELAEMLSARGDPPRVV